MREIPADTRCSEIHRCEACRKLNVSESGSRSMARNHSPKSRRNVHPTKPPAFEFSFREDRKKAFVTVACGLREQRQKAFGPAVVADVAGTFCYTYVSEPDTHQIGAGGGESNRRATLKSRKLLILRIARNAKTAKNVFRGYAAATRNAQRRVLRGQNRRDPKNHSIFERQPNTARFQCEGSQ